MSRLVDGSINTVVTVDNQFTTAFSTQLVSTSPLNLPRLARYESYSRNFQPSHVCALFQKLCWSCAKKSVQIFLFCLCRKNNDNPQLVSKTHLCDTWVWLAHIAQGLLVEARATGSPDTLLETSFNGSNKVKSCFRRKMHRPQAPFSCTDWWSSSNHPLE